MRPRIQDRLEDRDQLGGGTHPIGRALHQPELLPCIEASPQVHNPKIWEAHVEDALGELARQQELGIVRQGRQRRETDGRRHLARRSAGGGAGPPIHRQYQAIDLWRDPGGELHRADTTWMAESLAASDSAHSMPGNGVVSLQGADP